MGRSSSPRARGECRWPAAQGRRQPRSPGVCKVPAQRGGWEQEALLGRYGRLHSRGHSFALRPRPNRCGSQPRKADGKADDRRQCKRRRTPTNLERPVDLRFTKCQHSGNRQGASDLDRADAKSKLLESAEGSSQEVPRSDRRQVRVGLQWECGQGARCRRCSQLFDGL